MEISESKVSGETTSENSDVLYQRIADLEEELNRKSAVVSKTQQQLSDFPRLLSSKNQAIDEVSSILQRCERHSSEF